MRLYLSFEAKQEEQPRCFLFGHVITSAFRLLQAAFPTITISVSLFVTEENDGVQFNSVNTEREKHQKKTEEKEEIIII